MTEAKEKAWDIFKSEKSYFKLALRGFDEASVDIFAIESTRRIAEYSLDAIGSMPDEPVCMREFQFWRDVVDAVIDIELEHFHL
jgi:hypothetical protein